MKLAEGVDLHFIKNQQFKTNHLTFRFSGHRQIKTVSRRVLVAQMLATASEAFPNNKIFRERLANLYGTSFSTNVSVRGNIHIVDIDISFVSNRYVLGQENLLSEVLAILGEVLFRPLISLEKYQTKTFDIEKKNLIRYLEIDEQDQFYNSSISLQELYYEEQALQISKYGKKDLIQKENAFTAYQEFQKMLKEDKIDIFLLGDFDDYQATRQLIHFPLVDRQVNLQKVYSQEFINIVREKVVTKKTTQSILQLGYHIPIYYGGKDYYAMLVAEGMLGGFSHSKLFSVVREKESLAYTVGSRYDAFSGFLRIYAGIEKNSRAKTFKVINQQINELKLGRFSKQLVEQTKQMLIGNAKMSMDNPKSLIEQMYSSVMFDKESPSIKLFIDNIDKVSKRDIVAAVGLMKLQAVYFLEGESDESLRKD
ncbi:EF-P 5-aminopentanol modification-associated protein YfmF [Streptococcus sp. S784/96/1]|uniref:EF-P 5-aminopentanol modification-associated protein YfmF n=1 Tax=Streptococcus sp. S784/96/1 TaxID=2653499 RepID=UPI001386E8C4|nr:pitrilysin family protein [Streptococcus sp. S784/96/1]